MRSFSQALQFIVVVLFGALANPAWSTEPAQFPLLSRAPTVAPNLMLLFDDSNSMDYVYVYQDRKPGMWNVTDESLVTGDKRPPTDTYAKCAPEVNKIAYNPAIRYTPPKLGDGTFKAPGDINTAINGAPCKDGPGAPDADTGNPLIYHYWNTGYRYHNPANYTATSIVSGNTYPKSAKRTDCTGTTCTYKQEIQNYANWYTYHRRRLRMATTALSLAIADTPDSVRLGWAGMNTLVKTGTLAAGVTPLGAQGSATRVAFSNWLDSHTKNTTQQGTPSNEAFDKIGQYFTRKDSDGPWGTTPSSTSTSTTTPTSVASPEPDASHASCRRSYAMLVTDGYYTDKANVKNLDGVDGSKLSSSNGSVYTYEAAHPFKDDYSNTMADLAMKYWGTDLSKLDNNVTPIKGTDGDPAFWQHLNFMAVTMGLEGTIPQTPANLAQLKVGTKVWPSPVPNQLSAVDDLWHATINARGSFINAGDADELTKALNTLVAGILRSSATQGGVAVSTINLISGTKKFIPAYTSGQWTGNLIATELDAITGRETATLWQVETTDPDTGEEKSNTLGNPSDRLIAVGNPTNDKYAKAFKFTYANLKFTKFLDVMSPKVDSLMIDYFRGDRTQELGENPTYRKRRYLLGDIVNSNPTFVGPAIDYGYAKLPDADLASSYTTYLNTKRARIGGLVFIGANDGMLHAFQESDGKEVFAYIPYAVLPKIHELADKEYTHRYFVDGPTSQGDYHNGSVWRTAVYATAGAGAKSVFAIDATSNAPTVYSVLWEIFDGLDGFGDLGNVLSEVRTGRLMNNQWGAIFSNGVHSKAGKAVLYVVDAGTGKLIKALDTGETGGNGLGGVRTVMNSNNQVIGAYAGDLKGNLWKFDLSSSDPEKWTVSNGKVPLYVAKTPAGFVQAITAAPLVAPHPEGGLVVTFGTGRFFDAVDTSTTNIQSVYGIRDKVAFTALTGTSTISGVSSLVQQTISAVTDASRIVTSFDDTTSTQTVTYYKVSVNPIDWTVKQGWYFHMPFSGQRLIYPVESIAGKLAKVDTIVPGQTSSDP